MAPEDSAPRGVFLNTPVESKKLRHHRLLREQVSELRAEQARLERSVRRLEKGAKPPGGEDNEATDERLVERVARLEEAERAVSKRVFNVSRQVAELGRLHLSMLQLLETVEGLEAKLDTNVPELQKEISRMEFGMAQATSTINLLKEDMGNQRTSMKALGDTVGRLQERADTDRGHLSSLQAQLLNMTRRGRSGRTLRSHRNDSEHENSQEKRIKALEAQLNNHLQQEETGTASNSSSLPQLIQSLRSVEQQYRDIVHHLPHVMEVGESRAGEVCTRGMRDLQLPRCRLTATMSSVDQAGRRWFNCLPDCSYIKGSSGVYAISPGEGPPLLVSCDMSLPHGGWTVVQRRTDGSQDFNRKWTEYADGFGTPSGEFWLGNEALHRLTAENCSSLRVDMADIYGKAWVAEYEEFHISESADGYRIHIGGFSGNASDGLEYQNHMQFSAVDSDRDISNTHCAGNYEGGWWFSHCQHANLNGRYNLGLTWFDAARNEWIAVAFSEMKVRRREGCRPAT